MTLKEQVFAQAAVLAGEMEQKQWDLLDALCTASTASLCARLRPGLSVEACKADFIAAASLFALAAFNEAANAPEQFALGDLTVRKGSGDAASRCLFHQAQLMIAPYLQDSFTFMGV